MDIFEAIILPTTGMVQCQLIMTVEMQEKKDGWVLKIYIKAYVKFLSYNKEHVFLSDEQNQFYFLSFSLIWFL